jgi:NADH:ubiquinone oxidoreductase subunit 2 (subunit N)
MLRREVFEGVVVYALTPLAGDEVVYLYVGGYLFLMLFLAGLLSCLLAGPSSTGGAFFSLALSTQLRIRWLLVYTLLSLAGLPPFFFFACKLGLLSLLLCEGAFVGAVAVAALVVLSWAAYYGLVRYLVTPVVVLPARPLRLGRVGGSLAVALVFGGGVLCLGLVGFEELALLCLTLSAAGL